MLKSGLFFILFYFKLKLIEPLQSCCHPAQKIGIERKNWPGRLAGLFRGAHLISTDFDGHLKSFIHL